MLQSLADCTGIVALVVFVFLEDDLSHEATRGATACEQFKLSEPLFGENV
jgi:hypothetical protein